jgi:multiple sugar transport system ATP-binding protein
MTVFKNLAFGLRLRRVSRCEIERRVRHTAQILGLEGLLDRRPGALSGGQRQRVAVGRAMVREPACFLLDEPLSNLDAKLRLETRAELKRLHHRVPTTTIYVTHDQEEALTLGDRVVVMGAARIQQSGPPMTVYQQPVNRFVAGFVGAPPMNFIDGRLLAGTEAVVFAGGGLELRLDGQRARLARAHVGQAVVCGLRPEALQLGAAADRSGRAQGIGVVIQVVEPLGRTMDLHCLTAGRVALVARVALEPLAAATGARLSVRADDVHLFAPGPFGRNLLLNHGSGPAGAAAPVARPTQGGYDDRVSS